MSEHRPWSTVCHRCGDLWRIAEVRPDLPCCQVPVCDACAEWHRQKVAEEATKFRQFHHHLIRERDEREAAQQLADDDAPGGAPDE